ncbi:MAG: histidine--tRNA ligase [Candidatus Omnitrophica bacterium]|nr:histidine--tRNA ligase [Candidatus Omnitrophota bacterium]
MFVQVPRGTKDILPQEVSAWQEIERKSKYIFSLYNYLEIRTPIFENIVLFKRSLGDTTEIVKKQMFVFKQGADQFVLRPEVTASIARAYLENNLGFGVKLRKLFYIGPMFRAERPQKGRLRQFHHIGVEAIGSFSPNLDIEIIELSNCLLKALGISNYKFLINSLGCRKDKTKFGHLLKESLSKHKKSLCKDCQIRLSKNIFRVLDCKNEQCRQITSSLKFGHSYLCSNCKVNFDTVLEGLNRFNINYELREQLVRGLDYYSGVVFEVTHPALGAQDALGAGGRYDYLFKELVNKEIGAVGFAFGQERLMLVSSKESPSEQLQVYIITLGQEAANRGLELSRQVRMAGISCDFDYSDGSLKSKLKEANKISAEFVIIIGDDEITKGKAIFRFMKENKQEEVEFLNIVNFTKTLTKTTK